MIQRAEFGGDMAKMADGRAVTRHIKMHGEECVVTVLQSSKTVFVAYGSYKGKPLEVRGGTRQGALERWRDLANRLED